MALVQVIDIATGQVVAEYPIPPTEIITLEPGQEVVFGDVDYGDPNNPNVIIEVINDEHIQVTIDAGSLLIENLYKFLEEGEDAGLVFADSGQPFGTGPQALLVPSFDSLDAFTATAAGGPGADGGGTQTGTSGRGNDGGINPPDLNVDHLHAPTIEGVIPRPDFDFESDIVPEDPDEVVSSPVIVSISDAAPVQEPVLSDEEEEEGEGEGGAHCDDEGESEGQGGGGGTAGGIFVTGHDSDEHENVDYLNAGLDFLFFGEASDAAARTGHTVALLDNSLGTGGTGGNGGDDVVPLLNGAGWSATYFDTDFDFSDAFNFDAIVVASGTFGNTAFHDALIANSQAFTDFINNGGKLYINTDQGFGQDWYQFVPTFGASQAALGGQAVYTATAEGNLIGLTETIVDFDITHTEYQNVDTSIFTIFETHNTSGDVVAFGSNNLTIGDGGFQTGCDDFIMAEFTVFLETGVTGSDVTVTVSAADGPDPTATGGTDFGNVQFFADAAGTMPLAGNMVTIPAGDTEVKVYVKIFGDDITEPNEFFHLVISDPVNAVTGDSEGLGTILDNDVPTANPNDPGTDPDDTIVNEALGDLDGQGTVFTPVVVDGNVTDNDDFGGDGAGAPPIVGVTYDGALGTAVKTSDATSITFTASNWTLVITTSGADSGDYVFTQTDEYDHPTGLGTNSEDGVFTYTIEDGNGDQDSSTLTIRIVDDVPQAMAPEDSVLKNSPGQSVTEPLGWDAGADDTGSIVFSGFTDGDVAMAKDGGTLTANGDSLDTIYLYGLGETTMYGSTTQNAADPTAPGNLVFSVTIDQVTGDYTFNMITMINNGEGLLFDDFSAAAAGQNPWNGVIIDEILKQNDAPDTEIEDLLFTPINAATVNTKATSIGVNNQSIDPTQGLRIDFVENLGGVPGGNNGLDYTYTKHIQATSGGFEIAQITGGSVGDAAPSNTDAVVKIVALQVTETNNDTDFDNDTAVKIDRIQVRDINGVLIFDATLNLISGDYDATGTVVNDTRFDVDAPAGNLSLVVDGLLVGDMIRVFSQDGSFFERLEVTNVAGTAVIDGGADGAATAYGGKSLDIGAIEIGGFGTGEEVTLNFDVVGADGDGDSVSGDFDVVLAPNTAATQIGSDGVNDTLTGANDTNDNLYGLGGNDTLSGLGGDDLLDGGVGLDTMTGGNGNDIFRLIDEDTGVNVDVITDFTTGDYRVDGNNDALDIADLLASNGIDSAGLTLSNYLRVEADGEVRFDAGGAVDGTSTVVATTNALTAGQTVSVFIDTNLDTDDATSFDTSLTVVA